MKAVYRKIITYHVYLKDGTILSDDQYYCWTYGELPQKYTTTYGNAKTIFKDLLSEIGYFEDYDGMKTLFKKRRYITRGFGKRVYEDEMDYFEVKHRFATYSNMPTEWLQKNLKFKEYSELIFDREQELKAMLLQK